VKTLLIVGGTGFFGKSIIDYLSSANTNKFNIKKIITISRKRIFFSYKYITLQNIFQDIKELKKIPETDYVIYAATSANNLENINNLKQFINLLKKNLNKPKILFTSSGAVYGKNDKIILFQKKKKLTLKILTSFLIIKKIMQNQK
jgi:nucleoside-diphosphate-sugar epimerase